MRIRAKLREPKVEPAMELGSAEEVAAKTKELLTWRMYQNLADLRTQ